jgi:hypothetical protein
MPAVTLSGDSRHTAAAAAVIIFMSSTNSKCYFHFKIDLKGLQLEPFYFIFYHI